MIETKTTKYMVFELVQRKPKTSVWRVSNRSSGFPLGIIEWWWTQYCFFPSPNTVFDRGCMNEIVSFINELRQEATE